MDPLGSRQPRNAARRDHERPICLLGPGSSWESWRSGLPAADFHPPLIFQRTIVISLKTGGLYLSHDVGRNWTRLDGTSEAGAFDGLVFDGQDGFLRGITHEGVLHWNGSTSN